MGKTKDIVKNVWDDMVTGLTPEERVRIQNDPYVAEKFNRAIQIRDMQGMPMEDSLITESLYNEIGDKILKTFDEIESQLNETSPAYRQIRQVNTRYGLIDALPEVDKILSENDITTTLD